MQGFVILSLLFVLVGVGFGWGGNEAMSLPRKVAIFFFFYMTFFFANCGPGSTVYILPSLVFPEKNLSLCHGICACLGKFGGALGSSLYVPLIQAVGMTRVGDFSLCVWVLILGNAFFFGCGESGCFLYSFCLHCLLDNSSRRRGDGAAVCVCEREREKEREREGGRNVLFIFNACLRRLIPSSTLLPHADDPCT